jgi:hypothetical protein
MVPSTGGESFLDGQGLDTLNVHGGDPRSSVEQQSGAVSPRLPPQGAAPLLPRRSTAAALSRLRPVAIDRVVEPGHVLDDATHVPLGARRRSVPLVPSLRDYLAETVAPVEMSSRVLVHTSESGGVAAEPRPDLVRSAVRCDAS